MCTCLKFSACKYFLVCCTYDQPSRKLSEHIVDLIRIFFNSLIPNLFPLDYIVEHRGSAVCSHKVTGIALNLLITTLVMELFKHHTLCMEVNSHDHDDHEERTDMPTTDEHDHQLLETDQQNDAGYVV